MTQRSSLLFTNFNLFDSSLTFKNSPTKQSHKFKSLQHDQSITQVTSTYRSNQTTLIEPPTLSKIRSQYASLHQPQRSSMLATLKPIYQSTDKVHWSSQPKLSSPRIIDKEEIKLNAYLKFLKFNEKTKKMSQKDSNKLIENKKKNFQKISKAQRDSIKISKRTSIQLPTNNDSPFKKKNNELISIFQSKQKIMSEQQILYEERHKKEIEELRNTVKQLMKHLNALINYLNNNKKLYNVLRRFINMNRSLKQIFFNEKGDGIIDPITEETIMEKIKKKELFIMHGLSANISKYDFSVKHDLQQLSEQLQEFILDKKIDSYQRMQQNILQENKAVQQLEARILAQHQKV